MSQPTPIHGVYLSDSHDLDAIYGAALRAAGTDVILHQPEAVQDPDQIAFALCWVPGPQAFAPYPNLRLAMSIGAGVDALLGHPGLPEGAAIARVRDPHQADLMAGFALHEVLRDERGFDDMAADQRAARWDPAPMRAPASVKVAVLGHGTMGRAVAKGLSALGFDTHVACRSTPEAPLEGVSYRTGATGMQDAARGAAYLINVLPLTAATENVLNADLFACLAPGARLIQIGRGEHLVEGDLMAALDSGQLAGATLDVFRQEPLPADHTYWADARLRITPHVASDTLPDVVATQVIETARALRDGAPLAYGIDRARGY
ncbi:NAD(P)-dependent oxidoreductase [Pseudooceanicola sp. HF7]|uniref:NAD(P)-dependent oxidoreductase n=1 Tax=Pseudooceanicola sp. HF7 TaxID=2721560 RepID=UPI0014318210|nr:NAD(P)-dependent oxidoreductase [Pseudooceanicola sp. HF7]NIZ10944.1 hydroxyacid dehydrogenase [Pseudooceanicola sp. HF7]